MFSKLRTTIIKIFIIVLLIQGTAFALDLSTHRAINLHIANSTMNGFSLDQYLKSNLDFSQGIGEKFDGRRVDIWLELGGRYEDIPPWDLPDSWGLPYLRSVNHFHNPIPTTDQGYSGFWGTGIMSGMSSKEWALLPQNTQSSSCYLGCYSWYDVRDYYYNALTSTDQNTRNTNFKETFRGLGQLMHLIQDVSVPAHTRDDGHFFYNYEKWVRDETDISIYNPVFFSGTINDIASFIETDKYNGTNPDITSGTNIGLSEYTNANFFSNDTNAIENTSFTYPQITEDTDIVEKEFVNNNVPLADTYNRQYYKKNCCGEKNGGNGYLLSGIDYFEYYRNSLNPIGAKKLIAPLLDYNVYEDYAFLLIPRAIGYSAGLLNYFFRGEIEFDILNTDTITITNNSSEDMDGIFTLYYDAADGKRKPVSNGSWTLPPLQAGETSNELSFTEPIDIAEGKEYIIVFEGTLGKESNVVVGKIWECILFELVGQFVGVGGGDGQVSNPNYINTDSSFIYVSDRHNHRVQLFNYQGIFQDKFGSTGAGPGQFLYPEGIDVDDNFIYVADVYGRVQIFNKTSPFSFIAQFGTDVPSPPGPGEFTNISDVKVDSDFIYVADGYGHIQIFYKTSPYAYVATISGPGLTDGLHNYLNYFDIDNNYVYTVNSGNTTKVQIFNKTSYSFVSKVGSKGSGDGQFLNPQGITVDSKYIYVVDHENRRIVVFDKDSPYSFVTNFAINSGNLIDIEVTPSLIFLLRLYSSNRIYVYTNCP